MTQPTVNMTGRVESFTTKATQTDDGPKVTTKVVLAATNVKGDLDALVGFTSAITLKGLQGRMGGMADPGPPA